MITNVKEANKRLPLKGFPHNTPFQTKEQIDNYYAGEKIQCLLCGRFYKSLSTHIRAKHSITPDRYKEIYQLPWVRGLTCETEHNRAKNAALKRFAEGFEIPKTKESYAKAREASKNSRRGQLFRKAQFLKTRQDRMWKQEAFDQLLLRVTQQERLPYDICDNDEGMPSRASVNLKRKNDKQWAIQLKTAVHALPFSVLVKAQITPPRIIAQIKQMRKKGLLHIEIAQKLGTTKGFVWQVLNNKWKPGKQKFVC